MKPIYLLTLFLTVALLAACQPADEPPPLPTRVVLDTETTPTAEIAEATEAAAETTPEAAALPVTETPQQPATETPAASPTPQPTAEPSLTFTPTTPPSITPNSTAAAQASATAAVLEAPRLSTLTPAPGGAPSTPQLMADLTITERQFQEEVDVRVASIDSIQRVRIDFTPDGIKAELTALGGAAFITGQVQIDVEVLNGFAVIALGDVQVNAPQPPETYLQIASGEFFGLIVDVFDTILNRRLGSGHDLQSLTITDNAILADLLVPLE